MPYFDFAEIDPRQIMAGFHGNLIHTDRMTVINWNIEAGAILPDHEHPHEQISIMVEGQFEFTIAGETKVVGPGQVAVIPGNTRHSGRALTAVHVIDVFNPPRKDYQ
jgi:quercetin dioxygenase-like cupin family protein